MLLERYYDESLAQATYLIGCEACGDAIVIDPNRDVERVVMAAASHKLRIRYVTETHVHADYLSGSRALARATGAQLMLSGHGGADWSYGFAGADNATLLHDGDVISIGDVRLEIRHTPGHTPEHIVFLVTDTDAGDRPMGMVSGDFIFVGDVGRPDLLEKAGKVRGSMDRAARELFQSLQRTSALPDYLQIWPGHGAGSACGKALGSVPQTTLGYERLYNPAFQHKAEDDFVRWVLSDQPEPPPYFATMKRLNLDGPPARPDVAPPRAGAAELRRLIDAGAWIVDARPSAEFAREHLAGTINIPASGSFPTYAGTVLSYDRPIVLILKSAEQLPELARQLSLIGMDNVAGWTPATAITELAAGGARLQSVPAVEPDELAAKLASNGTQVVDVRGASEWQDAHLAAAMHLYLGDLVRRANELDRDEEVVVHCETGTRASIGASLLLANGFTKVARLKGGITEWMRRGLPVVRGEGKS
jgi:hydroxyacylglutathione hydrolase